MSMVERAHRRAHAAGGARGFGRTMAAGLVALVMIGAAHQVCFAGGGGGGGPAPQTDYDEGLGGTETAAIAVGAAIGVAAALGAFGGGLGILGGAGAVASIGGLVAPNGDAIIAPDLPPTCTDISEIRLVPMDTRVHAGSSRMFDLQVLCKDDKKWYSVTRRGDTSIMIRDKTPCLVQAEGTKNMFMVPVNASATCNGHSVVLVARFAPQGKPAMSAEARVLVRVP